MAVPRISALLMLRSTISTVSAPATCLFRGSITNPAQLLCTLRGRRYRRLTQHLLPGGPLRPYPDRSCTGWTAPAFVGAFGNSGRSGARSAPDRGQGRCRGIVRVGAGLRVVTLGRCPNSLLDRYHYPGRPAAAYWPSDWHLEDQDASS